MWIRKHEKTLSSFTSESTIHGLNYVGDSSNNLITRTFWLFSFLLSICGLVYYSIGAYEKWISPDIGVRNEIRLTNDIPFPSLTICPPIVAKSSAINFEELLEFFKSARKNEKSFETLKTRKISKDTQMLFSSLLQTCNKHDLNEFSELYKKLNFTEANEKVAKFLVRNSPPLNESIHSCYTKSFEKTRNEKISRKCHEAFDYILTRDGMCYSFNRNGFYTIFNDKEISEDYVESYTRRSRSLLDFRRVSE